MSLFSSPWNRLFGFDEYAILLFNGMGQWSPCTEEKPTSHSKRMRMLHIVAFVLFAISRIFSLINFLSQSGDRISVRYDDYNYQKTRIYDLFLNVFASKNYKMWWHLTVWYASNCMTNGIVFIHAICTCSFSWSFAHWNSNPIELRQVELTWIDSIKAQWMRNLHADLHQLVQFSLHFVFDRFFLLFCNFWIIFSSFFEFCGLRLQ